MLRYDLTTRLASSVWPNVRAVFASVSFHVDSSVAGRVRTGMVIPGRTPAGIAIVGLPRRLIAILVRSGLGGFPSLLPFFGVSCPFSHASLAFLRNLLFADVDKALVLGARRTLHVHELVDTSAKRQAFCRQLLPGGV